MNGSPYGSQESPGGNKVGIRGGKRGKEVDSGLQALVLAQA
jgi:hypothetical protein